MKPSPNLLLLPYPRKLRVTGGRFKPAARMRLFLGDDADSEAVRRAGRLASLLRGTDPYAVVVDRRHDPRAPQGHLWARRTASLRNPEAYRLIITRASVSLEYGGLPALAYGLETLCQLTAQFGSGWPCLHIDDEPAFAHRGYYLDVTRGKVPTLATLKRHAERLARFRYNQFQLYIEHTFDFGCDPEIGDGTDPLRSEDILELVDFCRQRHIELVPSLACFGHMGKILSLPQYRELAEVEFPARDWSSATWRQRLHGATIDPFRPGTRRLFERLAADFLPLFPSSRFNICADETYELGRGRNRTRAERDGIGELFAAHVRFLHRLAGRYGKRLMLWGDMMLHHPACIPLIPRDCTVLDWGYEPDTQFRKMQRFLEAGLPAYACPATRGFGVVFNQIEIARANILGYARTAAALGANGLLVTDWGDMGHFNQLACSLHGMLVAAAAAWNPRRVDRVHTDRAAALHLFGSADAAPVEWMLRMGTSPQISWPFLVSPLGDPLQSTYPESLLHRQVQDGWECADAFSRRSPGGVIENQDLEELALASEAVALTADKQRVRQIVQNGKPRAARVAGRLANDLADFTRRYANSWRKANRESELADVVRALGKVATQLRRLP